VNRRADPWFGSCILLNRYTDPKAGAGRFARHKRKSRSAGAKTMIGTQQLDDNLKVGVLALALIAVAVTGAILANKLSLGFAVAAVAAIIIFTFSFISQEIALYILLFSMLLGPQFVAQSEMVAVYRGRGVSLRFDDFLIAIIGTAWLMKVAINKDFGIFLRTPLNRPIAFYLLACAVATLNGYLTNPRVNGTVAVFFIMKYFEYFVVYFMAVNHLKEREQVRRFVITMLVVCFLICLYGIYQIPSGVRVSAPFEGQEGEPNTLGGYLIIMLSLVIGLLVTQGSFRNKLPLLILVPLILVPLAATHSRGSWVALPFMLLTLIFLSRRRLFIIVPLCFLLAASPLILPKSVIDRAMYTFTQPAEEGQMKIGAVKIDTSTSARLESWRLILTEDFVKRPLLGYGITGYSFVDAQIPMILTNTGVVGLIAFFILIGMLLRVSFRIYRTTCDPLFSGIALGYLGAFVGLLIHSIGANTFIIVRIMEPFWFLTAIVVMIPGIEGRENSGKNESADTPTGPNAKIGLAR
jgi:O-antigen ligase